MLTVLIVEYCHAKYMALLLWFSKHLFFCHPFYLKLRRETVLTTMFRSPFDLPIFPVYVGVLFSNL